MSQGTILVGGLDKVWSTADNGGRIQFFEYDLFNIKIIVTI